MASYSEIRALHSAAPAFTPPVPVSLLPVLAFFSLTGAFTLAFLFTTLHKSTFPLAELGTSIGASALAGFGVVALFCYMGVYV